MSDVCEHRNTLLNVIDVDDEQNLRRFSRVTKSHQEIIRIVNGNKLYSEMHDLNPCWKSMCIVFKAQTLVRSNEILKRSQVFYLNIPVYNFIRFQFCLAKLEINQISRCCRYRQSAGITIQWVDLNYFPDSSHFNQYNPVLTVITFNQPFKATRWHIDLCMYKDCSKPNLDEIIDKV